MEKTKEKIVIELDSFNLEDAKSKIVMALHNKYPLETNDFYSNQLGISERTLYRYFKKNNIKFDTKHERAIVRSISILESSGYKIEKA